MQRHHCKRCTQTQGRHVTYAEGSPGLVRGSGYAREVGRASPEWLLNGAFRRRLSRGRNQAAVPIPHLVRGSS